MNVAAATFQSMAKTTTDRHLGSRIGLRVTDEENAALRRMADDSLYDLNTLVRMGLTAFLAERGYLPADKVIRPRASVPAVEAPKLTKKKPAKGA